MTRRLALPGSAVRRRRRGAEEAGAIFIKLNRLDGTAELFGPDEAKQWEFRRFGA
jgi:hypothetical protein